jgi:UDP-4-amino-4,6-dideoxy-N-acetyl-beta-L-altrosamine N-acetyltransferase
VNGITLVPFGWDNLETVHRWRNHPEIRRVHVYDREISLREHLDWFRNLDPAKNEYFIARIDDRDAAVVNLKDIDVSARCCEWGIYLVPGYDAPFAGFACALRILDRAFEQLRLENVRATIRLDNGAAIRFNLSLGFEEVSRGDRVGYYGLDFPRYASARVSFRKLVTRAL